LVLAFCGCGLAWVVYFCVYFLKACSDVITSPLPRAVQRTVR